MGEKSSTRATRLRLFVILLGAAIPCAAGFLLIAESWSSRLPREVRLGDMGLVLERVLWLEDHSNHAPGFAMPPSMTPDMPLKGIRRFSMELTGFSTATAGKVEFGPGELSLVDEEGQRYEPTAVESGDVVLAKGQAIATTIQFDVPARRQKLDVLWERGEMKRVVFTTRAPDARAEVKEQRRWPVRPEELPPGDPKRGEQLFAGRFACNSCHGMPQAPGGNNAGPHLSGISSRAATRVEGKSALQYMYESMLDPNGFIAPECPNGTTCLSPSSMPYYGDMMEPQDMADVLAFLKEH